MAIRPEPGPAPWRIDPGESPDDRESRRVVLASAVGTTIEYYDFTLYGLASVLVFSTQFFPSSSPLAGQLGA